MPVKYHIFCVNCQANASDEYEEAVIGKWNTRAADQERDNRPAVVQAKDIMDDAFRRIEKLGLIIQRRGDSGSQFLNTDFQFAFDEQTLAKIEKEEK